MKEIKSIWKLLLLHLFPGMVLTLIYILFIRQGVLSNYPKLVLLGLTIMVTIVPLELGYLLYVSKKEVGSFNIFKVLGLKNKLSTKAFIIYTVVLFLLTGLLITLLKPVTDFLQEAFHFIPSWYYYTEDMTVYSRYYLIITIVVSFFVITLIGPIIEELYFRGFLLSRMNWMGSYGVLLNVLLFSVYHFWSPWMIVARVIAFLPLFYIVNKKKSLKLAISVHCIANFTDVVALFMLL